MHDHLTICQHDLKVCDHCDVAYCTKCKREWGNHSHISYWPVYPLPISTPYIPYQPYWGTVTVWNGTADGSNVTVTDAEPQYTLT